MTYVLAALAAVAVLAVALVAVGTVVGRLGREPNRSIFEHDEALAFVVEALPDSMTAELSFSDVERMMRLHLDFLHASGVARSGGDLELEGGARVIDAEDAVAYVQRRGALVGFFPKAEEVRQVLHAQLAYFEAIGAIAEVEGPDLAALEDELRDE
ncbi:MAG: hypothetical protein OEY23_17080 [Acidimicrobiia bacterium]|nr:hypothetical protein [Acidimicrobiia bacterium]